MHHLAGFIEEIDEAGAFANIAAAADQVLDYSGDKIRVLQDYSNIIASVAYVGTTGTKARLNAPSLEQFVKLYITPVNQVLVPTGNDVIDMHPESLIPLVPTENLECEVYADPAAAEFHTVGVWLNDNNFTPITGDIRPVPFTIYGALTEGGWNTLSITLEEELPAGNYELVGARLECTVATLARFILSKQVPRPGFVPSADEDFRFRDYFRYGRFGSYGTFDHISLPKMELLCVATTGAATYQGIMDVIRR